MSMDRFLQFVPFLLVSHQRRIGEDDNNGTDPQPPKLNLQRIIEAVVIAVGAGIFSAYISVAKLEVRVDGLSNRITAHDQRNCEEVKRLDDRITSNMLKIERVTELLIDLGNARKR